MAKRPANDTIGLGGSGQPGVGGTSNSASGSSGVGGMGSGQPPLKKSRSLEAPRFACLTQEELDLNVLRFQNKKLADRLITRRNLENDLRARIEQSEKKQTSAEAIVYVISR